MSPCSPSKPWIQAYTYASLSMNFFQLQESGPLSTIYNIQWFYQPKILISSMSQSQTNFKYSRTTQSLLWSIDFKSSVELLIAFLHRQCTQHPWILREMRDSNWRGSSQVSLNSKTLNFGIQSLWCLHQHGLTFKFLKTTKSNQR